MSHNSALVEVVGRLELWFEPRGITEFVDVGVIFDTTNGLWGCVASPLQISQALQKVGSPKLHTNDDGSAIRRGTFEQVVKYQIEYYFSDKNYHKDSFLQSFRTDGNPEGYVPTVELLRFSKMKRISAACPKTDMVHLIANVLADSEGVGVHSDRAHLRRLSSEEAIIKKVENFFANPHIPLESCIPMATLPKLQKYDHEFLERVLLKASSKVFELSGDKTSLRKKTLFSYKGALMTYPDRPVLPDLLVEPLPIQVTKYVEYLFSDANYAKDSYLQTLSDPSGFVPLKEIMGFPRMLRLCKDLASVAEWLRSSENLVVSEDRGFVRRKKPLPEFRRMVSTTGLAVDEDPMNSFTVMTYNVLADFLTNKFQFPYTTPETRNWESRKQSILKEVLFYLPDVVCLQEVQTVHHTSPDTDPKENDHLAFFAESLTQNGYGYIYKRKTRYKGPQTMGPDIGNAIFYNRSKFALISKHEVEFERVLWKECKKDTTARAMLAHGHPQVAVFAYLNHIPSRKNVYIATTHICSDFHIPYIQMRQVRACMNELQKFNKQKDPVILAGDFNAQPESPVYQFLSTGHLPKSQQYALQGALKFAPRPYDFHHEAGLASAYCKVLRKEPSCTNVTHEFEGTLDYLWYSKKSLRPLAVLDIPSRASLKEETGLPNKNFPSDHLPLFCKFKFHST